MIPETPTADEWRNMLDHERAKACGPYHQALLTVIAFVVLLGYAFAGLVVGQFKAARSTLSDAVDAGLYIVRTLWQ